MDQNLCYFAICLTLIQYKQHFKHLRYFHVKAYQVSLLPFTNAPSQAHTIHAEGNIKIYNYGRGFLSIYHFILYEKNREKNNAISRYEKYRNNPAQNSYPVDMKFLAHRRLRNLPYFRGRIIFLKEMHFHEIANISSH